MGVFGHVSSLRRTRVGNFTLTHAISLEKLEALSHIAPAFDPLLGPATALDDIPALAVSCEEAACLRHGKTLDVSGKALERTSGPPLLSKERDVSALLIVQADKDGQKPVAIGSVTEGVLRPVRVFNL